VQPTSGQDELVTFGASNFGDKPNIYGSKRQRRETFDASVAKRPYSDPTLATVPLEVFYYATDSDGKFLPRTMLDGQARLIAQELDRSIQMEHSKIQGK